MRQVPQVGWCLTAVLVAEDTAGERSESDTADGGQMTDGHRLHGRVTLLALAVARLSSGAI